jgi:hypothetical protein
MWFKEHGAADIVSAGLLRNLKAFGQVIRSVALMRAHDTDPTAIRVLYADVHRARCDALWIVEDAHTGVGLSHTGQYIPRSIFGSAIDNDDLEPTFDGLLREDGAQALLNVPRFVAAWDDNRDGRN